MTIMLGRRLVDMRFFHGHTDSAIDLAEDILYNLRHVYGPSHPAAVEMTNLLSSIYVSKGDRAAAMAVHKVDSRFATSPGNSAGKAHVQYDAVDIRGPRQSVDLVKSKIESLLHSYQKGGSSEKSVEHSAALIDELTKHLHNSHATASNVQEGISMSAYQPPANESFVGDRCADWVEVQDGDQDGAEGCAYLE